MGTGLKFQQYIVLLRGINVSGKNLIKMDALKAMFEGMKFKEVKTYIQSGNVLFKTSPVSKSDLQNKIAKELKKKFEVEVPVLLLEQNELSEVIRKNPFLIRKQTDISKLHVTLLSDAPDQADLLLLKNFNSALKLKGDQDEAVVSGNAVYLYCPNGYGNTKLHNALLENKLKRKATTRNWKTLNELLALSGMMKTMLVLAFALFSLGTYGQKKIQDSVIVQEEIAGDLRMYCKDVHDKIHRKTYTKADSIANCIISKTFRTDHIGVYYIREFDLNGKLRDEGYAKSIWKQRNFAGIHLKPKTQAVQKDGDWKFYDENGFKISDCCYKEGQLCDVCDWIEYDEKGKVLKEYKIKW